MFLLNKLTDHNSMRMAIEATNVPDYKCFSIHYTGCDQGCGGAQSRLNVEPTSLRLTTTGCEQSSNGFALGGAERARPWKDSRDWRLGHH
jgi:hypothetical protein